MSDSVQPHRWQPTRLPRPWDSPGKNTGVGCHFLLQCMKVKSESEVAQSCPTLSDPMDCSLPGSSVHGIFQAGVLEWGANAFSVEPMNSPHLHLSWLLTYWRGLFLEFYFTLSISLSFLLLLFLKFCWICHIFYFLFCFWFSSYIFYFCILRITQILQD